jgi:DNA-binding NtrC family response regulator
VSLLSRFLPSDCPPPSADLVEALLLHGYRFNVRELKEIATQLAIDGVGLAELPLAAVKLRLERNERASPFTALPEASASHVATTAKVKLPPPTREELEGLMIAHERNISRVARALGRSRRQIHRYLEQYGIEPEA